jgi:hypothetical protein
MSYISVNLATSPIRDIFSRQVEHDCPSGFEEAVFGVFPGTKAGCWCPKEKHMYE